MLTDKLIMFNLLFLMLIIAPTVTLADDEAIKLSHSKSACYEKKYSNAYLKMHPLQEVRWIRFEHPTSTQDENYMHIKVRFKSDKSLYMGLAHAA